MSTNRRKSKDGKVLKTGESLRKDGRYEYRKCVNGQKVIVYASTLSELRKKEEEIKKDHRLGLKKSNNYKTVNDMYEKWKSLKRGLKPNTFKNYIYMYESYVKSTFGKCNLKDIKKSDVSIFYCDLIDEKHLSISTVECIQTVLFQIFEMTLDDDLIIKKPTANSLKELKREKNIEVSKKCGLTQEEERLPVLFLKQSVKFAQWYPLVITMLYTGMRFGEASGLRWCDVDFGAKLIYVNHTVYYYDKGSREADGKHCGFIAQKPKTKTGERVIPMVDIVKEALLLEKQRHEEFEIKCSANINGYTDFIFLNQNGNIYNCVAVNRALKSIVKHCNKWICSSDIENVGIRLPLSITNHTFRHTFATRLCERGVKCKSCYGDFRAQRY